MDVREKLVELFYENNVRCDQKIEGLADDVIDIIDNGVTVQECGRWIDGDPYCPICRKDKFRGLDADVWADWKPDYCPNCGAKMDLPDECEQAVER